MKCGIENGKNAREIFFSIVLGSYKDNYERLSAASERSLSENNGISEYGRTGRGHAFAKLISQQALD